MLAAIIAESVAAVGESMPSSPIAAAFDGGKVSLNVRARYEGVSQTGLADADAFTLRTRLGFTTAPVAGVQAMIEAENVSAADGDRYSQAGLNPGGAGRAVVADPVGTEVNQAWLDYTSGDTVVKAGRQRLVLDNARFVGDVGWRQNQQTFDAVTVIDRSLDGLTLTYGYLSRVNRVFGDRHAQGRWDSSSHILHASYTGTPVGTLAAFAYLLDFDNAATNSTATYGGSISGTHAFDSTNLSYRGEFAYQSDYGNSPLSFSATYLLGEAGATLGPATLSFGYEKLGTDNGVGFRTPLATLHAFNGWADLFLATPAGGLRDAYAKAGGALPGNFAGLVVYHDFETDTGIALGSEWDLQLSRRFASRFNATLKYADFARDSVTLPNVRKLWFQIDFAY